MKEIFRKISLLAALALAVGRVLACPPPPHDDPSTSTNCVAHAQIIFDNIFISPNQPTNEYYDSIVCVGDPIDVSLQWHGLPATNVLQTCHTFNGSYYTNWCDPEVYVTGDMPFDITNGWWLNPVPPNGNDASGTNGTGNSIPSIGYTNATSGWLEFYHVSSRMPSNSLCGVWPHWADNARNWRSFAVVGVSSLAPDMGALVATNPDTYAISVVPINAPVTNLTVTATPNPWLMDKDLPAGWQMTGGIMTTNSNPDDVLISRTKRLVDLTIPGLTTITCVSGLSSNTVNIYVIKAEVESLEFASDHQVMTDNSTDWSNDGDLFVKPDWVPDVRTNPVSHAKDTAVSAKVVIKVQPSGIPFVLKGSSISDFLTFQDTANTSTGSDQALNVGSTNKIQNSVGVLSDTVGWSLSLFNGGFGCFLGNSGPHKFYVTYGTPNGSVPTEKRIAFVCNAANGKSDVEECADAIFSNLTCNGVGGNNWGPTNIWLLHNATQYSQCPGWAKFVSQHFEMLGIGGGVIKYCQAIDGWPYGWYTASDNGGLVTRSCVSGDNGHPDGTHAVDVPFEGLIHWASAVPNAFEATCFFSNDYYALGVGKYSNPKDVVKAAFGSISWQFEASNPPYNLNACEYHMWQEAP